jgi:hypothetical protein
MNAPDLNLGTASVRLGTSDSELHLPLTLADYGPVAARDVDLWSRNCHPPPPLSRRG